MTESNVVKLDSKKVEEANRIEEENQKAIQAHLTELARVLVQERGQALVVMTSSGLLFAGGNTFEMAKMCTAWGKYFDKNIDASYDEQYRLIDAQRAERVNNEAKLAKLLAEKGIDPSNPEAGLRELAKKLEAEKASKV